MAAAALAFYFVVSSLHSVAPISRLPNDPMLNIWLNMKKQLLYEENQKSGMSCNSLWMDSYVCGINTSSESIITFHAINTFLLNSGTTILREK